MINEDHDNFDTTKERLCICRSYHCQHRSILDHKAKQKYSVGTSQRGLEYVRKISYFLKEW